LNKAEWQSKEHAGLSWRLIHGDFLETMAQAEAAPDVIFYDMFSGKTNGSAWTLAAFRQLFAACEGKATELFTYTTSTASRCALLSAGFFVARGRSTGDKAETTIAMMPKAYHSPSPWVREFLGAEWLGKWHRSAAKYPAEIAAEQYPAFERVIQGHEQFRHLEEQSGAKA
jgi:queuine tRNA-ribosyltransferase